MVCNGYTTSIQSLDHVYADPLTGKRLMYRYWVPSAGGLVRVDTSRRLNRPGTLVGQPNTHGKTWRAETPQQVKADRRKERRGYHR